MSAKVVSELLVKPALRLMSGLGPSPLKVRARLSTSIRLDEVRPEYHRAVVTYDPGTGGYEAASTGGKERREAKDEGYTITILRSAIY